VRGSCAHPCYACASVSVDVVVPVFNEREPLPELRGRLRAAVPDATLVFVDNGSSDGTVELIEEWHATDPRVRLVRHATDLGYGRSLLDGFAASDGTHVVMIDADLEYWPEDVPAIVRALDAAPAVYGSRFLAPSHDAAAMPVFRRVGNRCVTTLFNVLFHQRLTDLYTGIRGVRRDAIPAGLSCDGFELVLELAARLAQRGARIAEVPAGYTPRSTGHSKMRHLPELLRFMRRLVALRTSGGSAGERKP
jgi:glycosyltransferase involved in cell wall biosynthesis